MTSCVSLVFAGRGRRRAFACRARVGPGLALVTAVTVFVAMAGLHAGAVVALTPDTSVTLQGYDFGSKGDAKSTSAYSAAAATDARDVWAMRDATGARITGAGVGVALIDSGVVPVSGLDASRVMNGPDLSFESQSESVRYLDTFGHGTHLAGIIAGRDPVMQSTNQKNFIGVAPGATLVSVKVASADGATDVSQVIAAIDWVVQHKDDPGLNIRVLNLSFGTAAMQDASLDPLSYAAEVAWRSGIVVVVAAGNDGNASTSLSNPAIDPFVIAVGAVDPQSALDQHGRGDMVASFSSRGSAVRAPDLVAPGRSIVSLRDPGSFIDTNHPEGRVDDQASLFRGSGTSQAAAVVSGAAALLLDQRPELTPDQVKRLLVRTAKPLRRVEPALQGAGQLRLRDAIDAPTPDAQRSAQAFSPGTGLGSLELARGNTHVADATSGAALTGEQDIFGQPWNPASWAPAAAQASSWRGGIWNGQTWTGDAWNGSSWTASTWRSQTWTASSWRASSWRSSSWRASSWRSSSWRASSWRSSSWRSTWTSLEAHH